MSYCEKISCRIAIQVCIGHFPDGRERHRTFSMKGINPDAPFEAIEAVVIALAPLLAHPITKVRKVTKREIFFYKEAAMPVPGDDADTWRVIPFAPILDSAVLPYPSLLAEPPLMQMGFISGREPPSDCHEIFHNTA